MSGRILLDMTRMVAWRWRGDEATGIDRVCRAYAARFADEALAAIQIDGRVVALDRPSSAMLFDACERSPAACRTAFAALAISLPFRLADRTALRGARYLNVGHSGFDGHGHWRSLDGRGVQRICFLHDLIPLTHPELTTARKTDRHRSRVRHALSRADGIIVNSQATAEQLRAFAERDALGMPSLRVAPLAPGSGLAPRPALAGGQAFVCLGTIEPRKNHAVLLRAWSGLIDRMGAAAPQLVIVGSRGLRADEALRSLRADPRLAAHVCIRSGQSDAQVAALLANARALLFPSMAEGFGLPIVEALQAGVPVLTSDLPVAREFGQGIPTLLGANDVGAWVAAIADHCGDCEDRNRQLRALPRFRASNWTDHFAGLEEWIARLPSPGRDALRSDTGVFATDRVPMTRRSAC